MKRFKANMVFSFGLLIMLLFSFGLLGNHNPSAYASQAAETKATENCSHISGAAQTATDQRAACHKGFVAGYDGGNKTSTCKSYSSSVKAACEKGFDDGKNAKDDGPETDGREGAATKTKSKADSCNKYHNADNKKTCEKAYDNQIIAMAQIDGQQAGQAGQVDANAACNNLGYGGNAAKEACKTAFVKGQNEAGHKPKGKCGEGDGAVETYFDFSAICAGTDKGAGGIESPIIRIGLTIVGWVTALVAVAVVGGVMYGGFLYLTARDNTGQTEKGVTVITNSVVALIAWGVAYALINFLVPGGLFHG